MDKEKDTSHVLQELQNVTSLTESLKVINNNDGNFTDMTFSKYFNQYLASNQTLKLSNIVNDSGLTRTYGYAVVNGEKKGSRDRIIALCFAAGMTFDETNHALKYAGHNELYARGKRDAVIIAAINTRNNPSSNCKTVTDLSILLDEMGFEPLDI